MAKNPLRNFTLKNGLFGATNIVANSDKEKFVYSGYGIAFDGKGEWSFGNDTARNVIIFGVDNSSSFHTDNRKTDFLILGEGPTFGINESFGASEKKIYINFSKAKKKFYLSLHYNADNSYLFVNRKKLRLVLKTITIHLGFFLKAYLMNLKVMIWRKYLLKEMCMIFQLIIMRLINLTFLNICKYLAIENIV